DRSGGDGGAVYCRQICNRAISWADGNGEDVRRSRVGRGTSSGGLLLRSWIGAAVTAALFTAGKYAIGLYLGQTAMASTFGAAGSFAVLLVWVYYSALISFFGAEFTHVYALRHGSSIRPESHAVRVGENPDET